MAKYRSRIPADTQAEVLFFHDHTCCVCRDRGLPVQVHHINENPADHRIDNLAVLCLADHNRTQLRGGFDNKLGKIEVIKYCQDWKERVVQRREEADRIASEKMAAIAATPMQVEVSVAPSIETFCIYTSNLPGLLSSTYKDAHKRWDTGITIEMNEATHDAISILQQIWTRLSHWYPPQTFGGVTAERYVEGFVNSRINWHRAVNSPFGEEGLGTIIGQIQAGGALEDLRKMIEETVQALIAWLDIEKIDFVDWKRRWSLPA